MSTIPAGGEKKERTKKMKNEKERKYKYTPLNCLNKVD